MHQHKFCHKLFEKALPKTVHKKRRECLTRFVGNLLDYDIKLSVTEIGKKIRSGTTVKHNIKSADYFASNVKFSADIDKIYGGLANFFWQNYRELIILVDWSGACANSFHTLKASVVGHGRSVPIYQEVHREKELENRAAHEKFLDNLKNILPENIHITIVTDAGFHREWFQKVFDLGWDFIGRVYSRYCYQEENSTQWKSVGDIEFNKQGKAVGLGKVQLGKTKRGIKGHLYSYKPKLSGKRHKKNKYPTHEKMYSDYYKNGWVIFSSLNQAPMKLVNFYRKRMQIEQNFRDIKNEHFGIGLRRNNSKSLIRIRMLYFLGTLLLILLWWIGLMRETQDGHRKYQANTISNKRVRSFVHLGRLVLRHEPEQLILFNLLQIIKKMQSQYMVFIDEGKLI